MRLGKKIWSILLTMVMVFAMMVPVMAEDSANITVEGTGKSFYAWKLMDAEEYQDANGKLTYKYTVNANYLQYLQRAIRSIDNEVDVSTANKVITYIAGLDEKEIQMFADKVYLELSDIDADGDYQSENSKFLNVPQGYYLIAEHEKSSESDTISKVILDTKGATHLTVETKDGTVELEKKVEEKDDTDGDTNLQDGADYDIGDAVPFQLKGTLPENYDGYKKYYYCFVDELSSGLSLNADSVKVYVAKNTVTDITAEGVIKADITSAFTLTEKTSGFELLCEDLKTCGVTLTAEDAIFVRYTATLTSAAKIGAEGNPNRAYLSFSNDPYSHGHGSTVEDVVVVFTYEYIVNKVDGAGDALEGAGFTLYKKVGDEWVKVGSEIKGENITKFEFKGLDSGTYKLEETTVPGGYNQADDIEFTITASYDIDSDNPQFIKLTIGKNEYSTGKVETTVENLTGTELPSTGGIGTTIFYAAGGILVVGAAVMLIAKKRAENEE